MRLFWRKGFSATSISDLCEVMEIKPPSLYAAYGNKEALYLQAVEHYAQTLGATFWARLEDGGTARQGVESLLLGATDCFLICENSPGGCLMMLGAVSDELPALIMEMVKKARADMIVSMSNRFHRAVADGELPAATDVNRLSRLFVCILHGMAVQARDGARQNELAGLVEAAMSLWPGQSTVNQPREAEKCPA